MTDTSAQTSVSVNARAGIPGMPFQSEGYKTVTRVATVDIPFGSYVAFDGEFCFIPTTAQGVAGREGGVALRSHVYESGAGYKAGDLVNVMTRGEVWVNHNAGATAMDHAYVRISASSGSGAVGEFAGNATGAAYAPGIRVAKNNGGAANAAAPTGSTLVSVIGVSDGWPTGAAGA